MPHSSSDRTPPSQGENASLILVWGTNLFGSGAIGGAGVSETQGCWFEPSLPSQSWSRSKTVMRGTANP